MLYINNSINLLGEDNPQKTLRVRPHAFSFFSFVFFCFVHGSLPQAVEGAVIYRVHTTGICRHEVPRGFFVAAVVPSLKARSPFVGDKNKSLIRQGTKHLENYTRLVIGSCTAVRR